MSLAGVGVIRFWGFSPALDLLEEVAAAGGDVKAAEEAEPLRFLIICPGDIRHVLKTLAGAHARRAENGPNTCAFEASVYEKEPEVLVGAGLRHPSRLIHRQDMYDIRKHMDTCRYICF